MKGTRSASPGPGSRVDAPARPQADSGGKAIFLASTNIGGVEIRMGRLFCALYDRDPSVYLVTHQGLYHKLQQAGIPLEECRERVLLLDEGKSETLKGFLRRKLVYLGWMLKSAQWARRYRFKTVYLACSGINLGIPLLFWPGIKVIIAYTIPFLSASGINWPNRMLLALWLNLCDHIDTLNPQNDLNKFVLNRRKVSVSPNSFTDLSRFKPASEKLPWVVWAGHLRDYKQPLFFIEGVAKALAQLGASGALWRFHMLGDGTMMPEVQRRIAELGLQSQVQTWGHVSDVAPFFGQAAICVSTQKDTNYPSQVLLEAMACENAIIATDVGETRLLADEETAILVNDPEEMATALVTLIRDDALRTRLGRGGRQRVAKEHTIERFVQHLESLWATGP